MKNEIRENLVSILGTIIALFLGGLFVYIAYNAVAFELNLPNFNYWVCVCGVGALKLICGSIGKIFHKD